jgi:hypothetical protein
MTILKSSQLKSNMGKVLDLAIHKPQYLERNGTLLVIMKADLTSASPWEIRSKTLESFYDPAKTW